MISVFASESASGLSRETAAIIETIGLRVVGELEGRIYIADTDSTWSSTAEALNDASAEFVADHGTADVREIAQAWADSHQMSIDDAYGELDLYSAWCQHGSADGKGDDYRVYKDWLVETTAGVAGVNEATTHWWLVPQTKASSEAEAIQYVGAEAANSFATLGHFRSLSHEGTGVNIPEEVD